MYTSEDTGKTVVDLFSHSPSTIHLVGPAGPVSVSGKEVAEAGSAFGWWLRDQGVARGERVAVWADNGLAYLQALAGCADAGLTLVNVNTRYSRAEATDLIGRSGASVVLTDRVDSIGATGDDQPLVVDADKTLPQVAPDGRSDASEVAPFVVFTTSGTTSKPKMVLHQQRSITEHAHDVAGGMGLRRDDVVLLAMPLCGVFGLTTLTGALAAGCDVVVPARFDVDVYADLITRHRITVTHGSDDMYHRLLEVGADLSSLRMAGYGAFNNSLVDVAARAEEAGATLLGLYGMSEVQALFAARNPGDPLAIRAKAGGRLISVAAECRTKNDELQLRGPSLFTGYLAEGGAKIDLPMTEQSFDGAWFRTGDLAEIEGTEGFHYLARMGDSLRLGGFLVAPAEIESTLNAVEGIDQSQVVAVDRPSGARPVAFVVTVPGCDLSTLEERAIEHCSSQLARYKVPVRVVPIDEFPTTPSANGTKIQKTRLREMGETILNR
ncbi:MAG: AMP-binding protein [Actinomycetia bacterium]|nr:AMP-binding protein [Actinomycetes bacterium]